MLTPTKLTNPQSGKKSWQAKRLEKAKELAKVYDLAGLLEYREYLIKNLADRPDYTKDVMVVKQAIELRISGWAAWKS